MSAFRRRTAFAAPLIISLVAGCSKKEETPPPRDYAPNPPPPERKPEIKTTNPPEPPPRPDISNPPRPEMFFAAEWDARRVGPGVCEAQAEAECAPTEKCNPPAPRAVECPPGTSGRTVIRIAETKGRCVIVPKGCLSPSCATVPTPCPLPAGQKLPEKLVEVWIVEKNKNGDGGCHAEEPSTDCPPGVDCNPPVPRKIACPPGVSDTVEVKVGLLPDKTCAVLPDGCSAPDCATTKTPCPPS